MKLYQFFPQRVAKVALLAVSCGLRFAQLAVLKRLHDRLASMPVSRMQATRREEELFFGVSRATANCMTQDIVELILWKALAQGEFHLCAYMLTAALVSCCVSVRRPFACADPPLRVLYMAESR